MLLLRFSYKEGVAFAVGCRVGVGHLSRLHKGWGLIFHTQETGD